VYKQDDVTSVKPVPIRTASSCVLYKLSGIFLIFTLTKDICINNHYFLSAK